MKVTIRWTLEIPDGSHVKKLTEAAEERGYDPVDMGQREMIAALMQDAGEDAIHLALEDPANINIYGGLERE